MESAGDQIRRLREAMHLSQEELAQVLKVTWGAVSQWETGRTHPRRATAMKLDEVLGANGAVVHALGYRLPTAIAPREVEERLAAIEARLDALERDRATVVSIDSRRPASPGKRAASSKDRRSPLPSRERRERTSSRPSPPPEPEGP